MSEGESSGLKDLCINNSILNSTHLPKFNVNIDELILILSKDIFSSNHSNHNALHILNEILQYRTQELLSQKDYSTKLLNVLKLLIVNVTNHSNWPLENLSENRSRNNFLLLNILQLSFEYLITLGEDGICHGYIQSFLNTLELNHCKNQLLLDLMCCECLLNAMLSSGVDIKVKLPTTMTVLTNVTFLSVLKDFVFDFENATLSSFVLYALYPKLIKVTNTHTTVDIVWNQILSDSERRTIPCPKKLFILCGLADFIVPKPQHTSLIESVEVWKLIQEGLVSSDAIVRKQALYLLKRSIDILVTLNMSLDVDIFSWNSLEFDSNKQAWEKMFILLEVLEEKQTHLIIPVVQSIFKTLYLDNSIHSSWLVAGFTRMFTHDSLQVIKFGVEQFLSMSSEFFISIIAKCTDIIGILFEKLNNMLLYYDNSTTVGWSNIDNTLRNWFERIVSHPLLRGELTPVIMRLITKVQWCAIPLFHIIFNMFLSPIDNVFNEADLILLSDFLNEAIKTQNVFIRGAVQCGILNLAAKGTNPSVNLVQVVQILGVFRQKECLARGLKTWETAKEWVSSLVCGDDEIIKILFTKESNLSIESKARSLVLFVDSKKINPTGIKFQETIKKYFGVLEDTSKRPYASSEKSDSCLKWILFILKELKSPNLQPFQQCDYLIDSLNPYLKESIFYIEKRLLELDHLNNYEVIELYVNVLQRLSEFGIISCKDAVSLLKVSKELSFDPEKHPVQQLLALKIMVWFIKFESIKKENTFALELIKEYCFLILKHDYLQSKISKNTINETLTRNHQVYWGWLLSAYVWALWSIIQECLDKNIVTKTEILELTSAENIIQLAISSIESGGRESLVPVLKVVKYIFHEALINHSLCQRFLQYSWKTCFELRKIALFWPSIKAWIESAFNKEILLADAMKSILYEFSEQILKEGESVNGLCNVLLSHLRLELTEVKTVEMFLPVLTKALIFGTVPRKDQRIESDTYILIGSLGSDLAVNDLIPHPGYGNSQQVRLNALKVILGVSEQDGGTQVVVSAIKQLIEMDNQLTAKRQRYHGDSLHHRIKHRTLQAVLVLHQALVESSSPLAKSCVVELIRWASAGLQGESHQPSVRYQLEWLLCRTLLSSPQLIPSFWTLFSESSEERAGSVCSFISVAYHLAATLHDTEFTERCVSEVLPWCMAQQFNIRLYAQVVLDKLWPLDIEVASKFSIIRNSLSKSLHKGNVLRNADKLKNDFYFTVFHPVKHFNLETIFMQLPRLSNISRDEWMSLTTIKDSLSNYSFLPLENPDDSLSTFSPSSWVSKATETEVEVEALAMQKKFVPWKSMFPDMESVSSRTQLIVVASLIDKLPNLGGLTRTCEIFAAECLVVPSLEFTKDKMFSTLSMTAEKHINIVEVKPHDLPKYLSEKKKLGYSLVGAEQTASSVSLESYKFPKKCLLLLGNEKEGVPVNLLPLLDVCVEVPQLGLVRSLNVHVTGALFVWEYTKQHLDSSLHP